MCGREEKYMILNIERRSRQTVHREREQNIERSLSICRSVSGGDRGYTMGILKRTQSVLDIHCKKKMRTKQWKELVWQVSLMRSEDKQVQRMDTLPAHCLQVIETTSELQQQMVWATDLNRE